MTFFRFKKRPSTAISFVLIATVLIPAIFDFEVGKHYHSFLNVIMWFIAVIYTIASAMTALEATSALRTPQPPSALTDNELPSCTVLVVAYLPNEQDIIVETLQHMLTRIDIPPDKLQVLLAYNTPYPLPVELILQDMAQQYSNLAIRKIDGSHSKSENINTAMSFVTGEIVAIFDSDHHPEPHCFSKAAHWLANGYDIVQGRCVIRDYQLNWLTKTVNVEFDTIYAVSHQGRSTLSKTAIFGGSNGYWRRETLAKIGMNPRMLTEDIDSSVRALLNNYKLVHDRTICSYELAPSKPIDWFIQRKRWAQGWFEVTIDHLGSLMRSPYLSPGQKVIWFYLLGWREIFPILSIQIFPLQISAWCLGYPLHWFHPGFFLVTSIFNLTIGLILLSITIICVKQNNCENISRWYWIYGLFGLIYTTMKTLVTLVAQLAHFTQDRSWVSTPRRANTPAVHTEKNLSDKSKTLFSLTTNNEVSL